MSEWKLVPVEATEEMLSAGDSVMPQIAPGEDITTGYDALREAWPAMVAAAPSPWQPIETAPKDGTKVLLRFGPPFSDSIEDGVVVGRWNGHDRWWLSAIWAAAEAHKEPTHWAPLPPPPVATDAREASPARRSPDTSNTRQRGSQPA